MSPPRRCAAVTVTTLHTRFPRTAGVAAFWPRHHRAGGLPADGVSAWRTGQVDVALVGIVADDYGLVKTVHKSK